MRCSMKRRSIGLRANVSAATRNALRSPAEDAEAISGKQQDRSIGSHGRCKVTMPIPNGQSLRKLREEHLQREGRHGKAERMHDRDPFAHSLTPS